MSYSRSVFFIPVRLGDFKSFSQSIAQSGRWVETPKAEYLPRYFLNYAVEIAKNESLFRSFTLKAPEELDLYMYEDKLTLDVAPVLSEVRFSLFSTSIGFLELWVSHEGLTTAQIADFSYRFKKAKPTVSPEHLHRTLYEVALSLIPERAEAEIFFTAAADFKCECYCYHFIHIDGEVDEGDAERSLFWLKRNYNSSFSQAGESDYDMVYKPYANDQWGGSCEGLVNITYDPKNDDTNRYLHEIKHSHLKTDYYFLYLLLLNQRFSCIHYITSIAASFGKPYREIEALNAKIVELKTTFAFNIISDDQIFQNVYAKMYGILGIDSLLRDILDNESQIEIIRRASAVKAEKFSSKLLFGISVLSIFSALIDASTYIDRYSPKSAVSNIIGIAAIGAIVCGCLLWIYRTRNER